MLLLYWKLYQVPTLRATRWDWCGAQSQTPAQPTVSKQTLVRTEGALAVGLPDRQALLQTEL